MRIERDEHPAGGGELNVTRRRWGRRGRSAVHEATATYATSNGTTRTQQTILASAAMLRLSDFKSVKNTSRSWQAEAWVHYDTNAEFRQGVTWKGSAMSRARLFVGRTDPDGSGDPTPVSLPAADAILEDLAGGPSQQGEFLRKVATLLDAVGEAFVVGADIDGERMWLVLSNEEIEVSQRKVKIRLPDTDQMVDLVLDPDDPQTSAVIRLWRPHPRRNFEADAASRPLLRNMRIMAGLASHVTSTLESRLPAGILWVPDSVSMPNPAASDSSGTNPTNLDPFTKALSDHMMASVGNDQSAGRVVPAIAKIPDEVLQNARPFLMPFTNTLDPLVVPLGDQQLKALAVGMDMPPEYLLGLGQSTQWAAFKVSEEAVTLYIEPLLALICAGLTEMYLQPLLEDQGIDEPDLCIWFDTSALRIRPNKGPEALELYREEALSEAAMLREQGFGPEDAPNAEERRFRLILRLVERVPALAPDLLPYLGLGVAPVIQGRPEPAPPTGTEPAEIERGRGEDVPDTDPDATPGRTPGTVASGAPPAPTAPTSAVMAAVRAAGRPDEDWRATALNLAAVQALDAVGLFLLRGLSRSQKQALSQIPAARMHRHVEMPPDKLTLALAGQFGALVDLLPDADCVVPVLDRYVRDIVLERRVHDPSELADRLAAVDCGKAAA